MKYLHRYDFTLAFLAKKGKLKCHCCSGEAKKFGRFKNINGIVQPQVASVKFDA
jgi:hypothetical protein